MQSDPRLFESLLNTPLHTHTHTSTSQHWELLEEARCYLTKTCWRQCVWVRRAVGIVDTLLPYVHPGCSPSAGLLSTDFLQKFLQGNRSRCVGPEVLPALSGAWLSGVYLLVLCLSFLLPSAASPAAGSGSVGFPHSANFTLTFFCRTCPPQHFRVSLFLVSVSFMKVFFAHLPFSHLQWLCTPLASLACALMCVSVCWQPSRCVQVFPLSLNIMQTCPCSSSHTELYLPIQKLSCLSWWTHLDFWVNTMPVEILIKVEAQK